jgi:hypothetical protein
MEYSKIIFWGDLDVSARTLENIPPQFIALWEGAHYRMTKAEIKRMSEYLARIRASVRAMEQTLSNFKPIAHESKEKRQLVHLSNAYDQGNPRDDR